MTIRTRSLILAAAVVTMATIGTACTEKAADDATRASDAALDTAKTGADTALDAVKSGTATAVDATQKAGEIITDTWITAKISAKFVDEALLEDSHINVDSKDHVVTLTGTVSSAAAKRRAGDIVTGTEHVTRLINDLTVKAMQ